MPGILLSASLTYACPNGCGQRWETDRPVLPDRVTPRRLLPPRQTAACKGCGLVISERWRRPCKRCGSINRVVTAHADETPVLINDSAG